MSARQSRIVSLGDKLGAALDAPDRQSAGIRDIEVVDPEFVEAFQAHFRGFDVVDDPEKVRAAAILRNSLRRGTEKQLDVIVEMGRALLRAQKAFSRPEWNRLMAGGEKIIGIPKARAAMYRAVADAVDGGRIPKSLCPSSYSTTYQLTLLSDLQLRHGIEKGVVRPDVTRQEVEEFRRQTAYFAGGEGDQNTVPNSEALSTLLREQQALEAKQGRLQAELEKVRRRLSEIRKSLQC